MQFVNIVVHSVEDMNFRVHLQHEFTLLGLDEYLEVSNFVLFGVYDNAISVLGRRCQESRFVRCEVCACTYLIQ